ncbi:MAG: DivIVA domain-containing protein [Ruminococcaceae bacterium]|nr:DivIVA domain-containing protein [Oscillospiraceae bacterium]
MLTPQEVSERAFAKASFGGYNMAMVDEFLDLLTADYSALYSENAVLKSKMKVLVEKVEEYRSTEEAMRKALMTAQRMADELVREAEQKKADLLRDAEREVAEKVANLRQEVINEEYRLTAAKNATIAYVEKVKSLHRQEQEYLANLDQLAPTPQVSDQVDEAAQAIDDSVQRLLAAAQADVKAELEREELDDTTEFAVDAESAPFESEEEAAVEEDDPADLDKTTVHHIDFGNLQFGRDYEIK